MSEDPVRLSLRLWAVLERIGVSEGMRKLHHDTSISNEITRTITANMTGRNMSEYIFGSSCEGTTTSGMGSDMDTVLCYEYMPVIEDIREDPPSKALLMVKSTHTRPGYVKLQFVLDGTPITIHNHNTSLKHTQVHYDCEGRVCLKHLTTQSVHKEYNERNGPADSISNNPGLLPVDAVAAFRSKTFPYIATESLNKCNACGWMSREDIKRMKHLGLLLVGAGHQASEERDIEWRISFSLQERELMLALNPTQHKCYFLLKIVKNLITAQPGLGKSLTSYQCKTCLFTVITDTSPALWTEENLIKCTFICLSVLKSWIYRGYCPNFFIKQNNMFERREFVEVKERLLRCLRNILHEGPGLLYRIESDHIGEALYGRAGKRIDDNRSAYMHDVLFGICENTSRCQRQILDYCKKLQSDKHITHHLFQQLRYLTSIETVTEHTHEQTQGAVRRLEPVLHKLYAQQLASDAFSTEDHASRHRLLETCERHLSQGRSCDRMSGGLLDATILYKTENLDSCCILLKQTEQSIRHGAVVSLCMCCDQAYSRNDYLVRKVSSGNINHQNIMESAAAPCMMFLPTQSKIIPKALQYEMYRSVYASPESRDEFKHSWYDFAVVDSKIYLHFLQYLVYTDLNKPVAKRIAIDQILNVMLRDPNLQHRETAYNLLGWTFVQEGRIQDAINCFCQSWRIRPDHNAAKWHVQGLLMHLRGRW